MIVLILYINLLNLSWIKISIFEEYGAFNRGLIRIQEKALFIYVICIYLSRAVQAFVGRWGLTKVGADRI